MDGDNFREDDQVSQSIFKERKTLWSARRFVDDKSNRFTFKNSPLDITIILIEMIQVSCINFYYILCDLIVNAASNGKHDYILWREFYRLFFSYSLLLLLLFSFARESHVIIERNDIIERTTQPVLKSRLFVCESLKNSAEEGTNGTAIRERHTVSYWQICDAGV